MAIIDLTIENPAFKHVETFETSENAAPTAVEDTETTTVEDAEPTTRTGDRLRRTVGVTTVLAVGLLGALTFRKFRGRRNAAADDQPAE